jgi:hypothetical protein
MQSLGQALPRYAVKVATSKIETLKIAGSQHGRQRCQLVGLCALLGHGKGEFLKIGMPTYLCVACAVTVSPFRLRYSKLWFAPILLATISFSATVSSSKFATRISSVVSVSVEVKKLANGVGGNSGEL